MMIKWLCANSIVLECLRKREDKLEEKEFRWTLQLEKWRSQEG